MHVTNPKMTVAEAQLRLAAVAEDIASSRWNDKVRDCGELRQAVADLQYARAREQQ